MVPGDMYEWSRVIFAKKSKFHDAGGPDTVVSPLAKVGLKNLFKSNVRRSQFSNFTIENILGEHVRENEIEENENKNMLSRIKQEKIDILGRY